MIFTKLDIADMFEIEHEITMKNKNDFQSNMTSFLNEFKNYMILNLEKLLYLNNYALGIIAESAITAQKNNKELVIVGMRPAIRELFEIVKFNTFMRWFATIDEALAYFKSK